LLQQIQQFSPEDWQGKKLYLYRVWPVIDKKGDDHFIAKLSETVDEDFVLQNWGSGRYHLRLNGRRGETIATQTLAVHNPKFPPKVDVLEVIQSDPRNESYFAVWGPRAAAEATPAPAESTAVQELSRLVGKVLDQKTAAPAPQSNVIGDATAALLLGMSKGRDDLAEKLASHAATSGVDPVGALDRAVELLKKLQPSAPADSKVDLVGILRDELTDVRKQLAEDRAEQRRLQQELFSAKTKAPALADPVEELTKSIHALTRMREIIPGAEGIPSVTEPSGWLTFFQGPVAAVVVNEVAAPLGLFIRGLAQKFFAPGSPLPPPPPQPGAPAAAAPQPGAAAQSQPQDFGVFLDSITPRMIHFLRDFDEPAVAFASWFHEGYADAQRAIDTMVSLGGVPALIAWYRTSKHWPAVAPIEAEFTQFLADVVRWKPKAEDEATASADATAEPVIDLEFDNPSNTNVP
jgi:hypothetical protein